LDGRVEGAIRQSRPIDGAAQNFYQIRVWPFEHTVVIETAELAVWTVQAQHILKVIQCLECRRQRAFPHIPIRMIDHQGDFGAQRSGFALNALERSREDSGQAGQGSCTCCEQNETTAVHCVWERLNMPDRVSTI
jgi:hypothetical protein